MQRGRLDRLGEKRGEAENRRKGVIEKSEKG